MQAHRWPTELLGHATWLLLDSSWRPVQAAGADSFVMLMEGDSCFGPCGDTVNVATQDRDAPNTGEPITMTELWQYLYQIYTKPSR